MAGQPSSRPPSPLLKNDEFDLHSLREVATMREMFLEASKAKKVGDGKMKEKSGGSVLEGESSTCGNDVNQEDDAYTSAPDEELGNADDIDSEEEYRKEMEEQRSADRINGHFSASSEGEEESFESTNERERSLQTNLHYRRRAHPNSSASGQFQATAHTSQPSAMVSSRVAAYEACASSRVSGKPTLYDAVAEGGKRERERAVEQNVSLGASISLKLQPNQETLLFGLDNTESGGSAAVHYGERGVIHSTNAATKSDALGGCASYGTDSINGALHSKVEQPNMDENSLMLATNQELIQPPIEVNPTFHHANSSNSVLGSDDKLGAAFRVEVARVSAHDTQRKMTKNLNEAPPGHGIYTSPTQVLDVLPISAISAEEAAAMDLLEAQPLIQCQTQHLKLVIPSPFVPYKPNTQFKLGNPKPNLPPSKPNLPPLSSSRPNNYPFQTATQSKPKPPISTFSPNPTLAQSNPKFKHVHKKTNTQISPSITKEIKDALFGNPMHLPRQTLPAPATPSHDFQPASFGASTFPPLRSTNGPAMAATVIAQPSSMPRTDCLPSFDSNGSEDEGRDAHPKENDTEEMRRRKEAAEAKGKFVNRSGAASSWANMVEKEHGSNNPNGDANTSGNGGDGENHSKVFFGRSMADVLRSGQPTDGPILLDHARAQKRGEVRMIEGRPCLFFSSDESTDLAGRIGPAIVGKFSHSIPTAHQIQKALGNIKLKGTLSWNFLNAKHVFIQLSEMSDYVRILNGPNNSPVWYIELHPMRAFKWTPPV